MDLTADQYQAVENGEAVAVKLRETDCVVLRKDVYDRIATLLNANQFTTDEERARLGWEAGVSIGWNNPEMTQYDDYDAHRK